MKCYVIGMMKNLFWVAILNNKFEVVAAQRMITTHLLKDPLNLDILNYHNVPSSIKQWIQEQKENIGESDRTVVRKEYRRMHLYGYIVYHFGIYMLNPNYWGTNKIALATFPQNKPHVNFMKIVQGIHRPEWSFKYYDSDPYPVEVFILPAENMVRGMSKYFQKLAKL